MSLSSRRAWIEIAYVVSPSNNSLRSLSSRRAWIEIKSALTKIYWFCCRSPHGERGLKFVAPFLIVAEVRVALLTESVDWNNKSVRFIPPEFMSLSSRRAWIEITRAIAVYIEVDLSLSSRRAWIEILKNLREKVNILLVALLTESVDWNVPNICF